MVRRKQLTSSLVEKYVGLLHKTLDKAGELICQDSTGLPELVYISKILTELSPLVRIYDDAGLRVAPGTAGNHSLEDLRQAFKARAAQETA